MAYLALGLLVLLVLYLGGQAFANANPAVLSRILSKAGGLALLGIALALLVTGRIMFALGAAAFAMALLRGTPGATPSAGQTSRVTSATLDMTLDHETGEMEGTVTNGPHGGHRLSELALPELLEVLRAAGDEDGERLMEAYLDRRFPRWREDVHGYANGGRADEGAGGNVQSEGPLTPEEARDVLGLQPGATAQEVREAHRAMMKRVHPDFGGSAALAARVNAAKDLLLRHETRP